VASPKTDGSEAAVYKDQLSEIDRDVATGLIGASEAGAARVEISRRLLAAADHQRDPPIASSLKLRRSVAVLALIGLPIVAVALYLPLGSPRLGDFPLAERTRAPNVAQTARQSGRAGRSASGEKIQPMAAAGACLPRCWRDWAATTTQVRAFRNSITYNGDSADRRADLGEALAGAAGGVVTSEAKAEFERAVALNADEVKASYFLGLAAEQDGRSAEAASIWRAMLAKAPADAPWRPLVQAALARVGGAAAPTLSDDAMAAAKGMSETDRGAMIRGMVERLASRLKQNGDDVEGWLRLVRAYMVMGDRDKARSALVDARQAVANDAERLRQLNEGLKISGSMDKHDDAQATAFDPDWWLARGTRGRGGAGAERDARFDRVFLDGRRWWPRNIFTSRQTFRLGGLVEKGSLVRGDNLAVSFKVSDGDATLPVTYRGISPGPVSRRPGRGRRRRARSIRRVQGRHRARKHDETYMPKDVADALKKQGHWKDDYGAKANYNAQPAPRAAQSAAQPAQGVSQ